MPLTINAKPFKVYSFAMHIMSLAILSGLQNLVMAYDVIPPLTLKVMPYVLILHSTIHVVLRLHT